MATPPGDGGGRPGARREPPAASVEEALERASRHGRAALAETLAAARAVFEAAFLAASGRPAAEDGTLGLVLRSLDELAESLSSGLEGPAGNLLRAVAEALEDEIARWEARADDDPEARAVLRAYLGLREILWELGVRPSGGPGARRRDGRRRGGGRVQRVPVDT